MSPTIGSKSAKGSKIQRLLEDELISLKSKLGLAGHLRVVWNPNISPEKVHGMVQDSTIYIFDIDEQVALYTLKHEYIEYILTHEFLEPRIFETQAHRRADALIDIIADLI